MYIFNSNYRLLKKLKQKRCKDCIYKYREGNIFACQKSKIYIEPLKLICFKKRRGDK